MSSQIDTKFFSELTPAMKLRRLFRVLLLILWCVLIFLLVPLSLLCAFGKWRKCRVSAWWTTFWAKGVARILNIRVAVCGTLPEEKGFMVVSNHLGYLDVIAHASVMPLRFAPKAEIKRWPVFGALTSLGNPVWIDRKNPRMAAAYAGEFKETVEHQLTMLVYPEGTSTSGRSGLLKFKSTPFAAALEAQAQILPTLLFYRHAPESRPLAAWHDDTPFDEHVWNVLGLDEIVIDIHILPAISSAGFADRKALTDAVYNSMTEEYWKIERTYY